MKISKKLVMALIGGVLIVANDGLGLKLPQDSILSIAGIFCSYILGQSAVDLAKK